MIRLRPDLTRRLLFAAATLLGCALLAFLPASARAVPGPIADCNAHAAGLRHHYSDRQLQQALKTMSPTTVEYGNCEQVIQAQLDRQLADVHPRDRGSSAGDSSGGTNSTLAIALIVFVVLLAAGGGFVHLRRRGSGSDGPHR